MRAAHPNTGIRPYTGPLGRPNKSLLRTSHPNPDRRNAAAISDGIIARDRLGRYRRLSKDYEELVETSESMIYLAMTNLMIRRLCPA